MKKNTLIVLVGPTGVGKTDVSIQLARHFACPIVSADSRQMYRELSIGTAPPSTSQLAQVPHYFIANKSITEPYSAGQYELDVVSLLDELFKQHNVILLVGGSMMYIDAVCKGLDDVPTIAAEVRNRVLLEYEQRGLSGLCETLKELDPKHYQRVDVKNKQRVMHALEVCYALGRPYSDILTERKKQRPFNILKIGVNLPREVLYQRINTRVDQMLEMGLQEEVKGLYAFKDLNALNTVGYKEWFPYFEGNRSFETVAQLIKQNSRRYAKRQLTWFNADKEIAWFLPGQYEEINCYLKEKC